MKLTEEQKALLLEVQENLVNNSVSIGERNRIREVMNTYLNPEPPKPIQIAKPKRPTPKPTPSKKLHSFSSDSDKESKAFDRLFERLSK